MPDKALDLQHVRQAIIDWMNGNLQSRFLPEDWFQREVHGYLGVNPAELGFDVARGYQVYETKRGRLLIVRQENLTRLPDALAELLTVPPALFSMSKSNVMEGKAPYLLGTAFPRRFFGGNLCASLFDHFLFGR